MIVRAPHQRVALAGALIGLALLVSTKLSPARVVLGPRPAPEPQPEPLPEPLRVLTSDMRAERFGSLPHTVQPDGCTLTIDPQWEAEWIVRAQIPELGGRTYRMHRAAVGPFRRWLQRGLAAGLLAPDELIQASQVRRRNRRYGECHGGPSAHAYGLAWDLDPARYPDGSSPDSRTYRLAQLAALEGIGWLGHAGDPMHFEVLDLGDGEL